MLKAFTFSEAGRQLNMTFRSIDYWVRRWNLNHYRCQSGFRFFDEQQFEAFKKFRADRLAQPIQRGRKRKERAA